MKKSVGLIILIVASITAQAQSSFLKYYGASFSNSGNYAYSVIQVEDGGYVFTGVTLVSPGGTAVEGKMMLYKTDENGKLKWAKHIPFVSPACKDENGFVVRETPDQGYLIAATCSYGLFLVRTDINGTVLWQKATPYYVGVNVKMELVRGGGFAVCGSDWSIGKRNVNLIRFDDNGNVIWDKSYDYLASQSVEGFSTTQDGGFIIASEATTSSSFVDMAYVIKTDAAGDTLWTRQWQDTAQSFRPKAIIQTSDGGYLMSGGSMLGGFYLKLDNIGAETWRLSSPGGIISYGICEDPGKGWYSIMFNNYAIGMQKIAYDGSKIIWDKVYTRFLPAYASAITKARDGGLVLNGYGSDSTATMAILVKTDTAGNIAPSVVPPPPSTGVYSVKMQQPILITPNPSSGVITISSEYVLQADVRVVNAIGQIVATTQFNNSNKIAIDISQLSKGIYSVILNIKGEGVFVQKLVKE